MLGLRPFDSLCLFTFTEKRKSVSRENDASLVVVVEEEEDLVVLEEEVVVGNIDGPLEAWEH